MVSAARGKLVIRGASFRRRTPPRTRFLQTRAITIAAKTKTLSRASVLDGTSSRRSGEVGEQVQRPRHEHRAVRRPRARVRVGALRAGPPPSPFVGNHRPASVASSSADRARSFDDAVATSVSPDGRERREHPVGVLVARGSTRRRRSGGRAAAAGASRRRRGCARRRGSRAASPTPLEPAGERTRPRPRPDRPAARGTSLRRRRRARGSSARVSDGSRRRRERLPLRLAEHDGGAGPDDRELLARRSPRASRRGRRCARGRRS